MDDTKKSADEVSKKRLADKLITKKALYFVPEHSVSIEADSPDDAVEQAKKLTNKEEDGDD